MPSICPQCGRMDVTTTGPMGYVNSVRNLISQTIAPFGCLCFTPKETLDLLYRRAEGIFSKWLRSSNLESKTVTRAHPLFNEWLDMKRSLDLIEARLRAK